MTVGTVCEMQIEISEPNLSTDIHVEILSPNRTQNIILGYPSIMYDNVRIDPKVDMKSSYGDTRVIIFLILYYVIK